MAKGKTDSAAKQFKRELSMIDVTVEQRKDLAIMHLDGKLYFENLNNLIELWRQLVENDPRVIAMNCKELDGIDSTSIGTLVQFFNEAMKKEIELVFYDLNPSIKKLFRTIHLEQFFTVTTGKKFVSKYGTYI
ncbi:MAG TPA: STAS domain-containing protein [Spirochaetota bacterium]|nr:STAS domain-containing protein [Spirochaetota bacterium]